jgi:acyl dehydratase
VLDDPNPIHLDPEAVRALGMGDRVVNQGPANFAWVLDMLREAVPGAEILDLKVRLLANVFAEDRVVAAGRVEAVEDGRVSCSVWLDVDGGSRAVDGTATLILPTD